MIPSQSVKSAFREMPKLTQDYLEGAGVYLRWRHQDVGNRTLRSDNAMGTDPTGMTFETQDYHKKARKQGTIFYSQFVPIEGDLLITLKGGPTTKDAALKSKPAGYYVVTAVTSRRADDGSLVYCKVETEPDHSGQW